MTRRATTIDGFIAAVRGLVGQRFADDPPSMRLDDTRYTLNASVLGDAWDACGFPPGGSVRCWRASLAGRAKGALMKTACGAARDPAEARRAAALARWVGVPWAIVTDGSTWRLLDTTTPGPDGTPTVAAEVDLAAETAALKDSEGRLVSDDVALVGFTKRTRRRLQRHLLPAWTPVVETDASSANLSRFGGSPWLPHGETVPNCGHCGRLMKLFLQLDRSTLPAESPLAGSRRLFQFFFCTSREPHCEFKSANSCIDGAAKHWRIRSVDSTARGDARSSADDLAAKSIVAWRRFVEFPDIKDLEAIGFDVENDDEGELLDNTQIPLHETKLGGWPGWMQIKRQWIDCPECGVQMRQVFQFESEEHVDWSFGGQLGGGRGHVLYCPKHPERFGFSWAYMC